MATKHIETTLAREILKEMRTDGFIVLGGKIYNNHLKNGQVSCKLHMEFTKKEAEEFIKRLHNKVAVKKAEIVEPWYAQYNRESNNTFYVRFMLES